MLSVSNVKNYGMPNGIILYRGPSLIDGKEIVVIATGFTRKSKNGKTGDTIQTWILPTKVNPIKAWTSGKDHSVCGNCKHSSIKNGGWNTCYVNVYQAPYNVWTAWKNGSYARPTKLNLNCFRNKIVRLGSYGDPAAVPVNVWETITSYADGWLGYTHQWHRNFTDQSLKRFCMASCDTEKEAKRAKTKGWRTFRVRLDSESVNEREIICPASNESGKKFTCEQCGLCSGIRDGKDSRKDITIIVHGRGWKCQRFAKIMKRRKNKKSYRNLLPI